MASSSSTSLATCHRDVVAFVKSYEDESLTVASGKGGGGGGGGNVALFERRRRRASRRTKMRDVVVSAAASADDVVDDDDDAKKSSSSTVGVLSQILAGITVSLAMVPSLCRLRSSRGSRRLSVYTPPGSWDSRAHF